MSALAGQNVLKIIRRVGIVFPQVIRDNADYVGGKDSTPVTVDTVNLGVKAEFAAINVMIGAIDVAMAQHNVFESDDDSTYTEIAGLDFVLDSTPPGPSNDNTIWTQFVDCRNKKRYLQLDLMAGNGTTGAYAAAWADLFALNEAPDTDTERGLAGSLSA